MVQIKYAKTKQQYIGQMTNTGQRTGEGILFTPSGDDTMVYKGPFVDGVKEGKGEESSLTFTTFRLQGIFKDDKFHKGTYTDKDGNITRSKTGVFFKNTRLDGDGVQIFKSGEKFEGEFKDGQRSGKGTMTYFDKSYDIHGYGLQEPAKLIYTGQWKHNKRNGKGTLVHDRDGSKFEGTWNNDEK